MIFGGERCQSRQEGIKPKSRWRYCFGFGDTASTDTGWRRRRCLFPFTANLQISLGNSGERMKSYIEELCELLNSLSYRPPSTSWISESWRDMLPLAFTQDAHLFYSEAELKPLWNKTKQVSLEETFNEVVSSHSVTGCNDILFIKILFSTIFETEKSQGTVKMKSQKLNYVCMGGGWGKGTILP